MIEHTNGDAIALAIILILLIACALIDGLYKMFLNETRRKEIERNRQNATKPCICRCDMYDHLDDQGYCMNCRECPQYVPNITKEMQHGFKPRTTK